MSIHSRSVIIVCQLYDLTDLLEEKSHQEEEVTTPKANGSTNSI